MRAASATVALVALAFACAPPRRIARLGECVLGVSRLHAVVGTSAGGMQVFHWLTAHPEFVDRGVAIAGSPRSSPGDKLRWETWADENTGTDFERQARAIAGQDVSAPFGGSDAVRAAVARFVGEQPRSASRGLEIR